MKKLLNHLSSEWYKYGLETLVVIIGILTAFGLNNWNDSRKDNNLKDTYLEALVLDVQGDIENLNTWKQGNDDAEEEGLYLLNFLENKITKLDSQRLVRSFLLCQYKPAITISVSTYSDLVNSGNIRVFNDLHFKKQLDEYYKIDNWSSKIDDRITQTIWYDYRDKITEFIDPTIFKEIYIVVTAPGKVDADKVKKLDLLDYEINWIALKESPDLLRQLRIVLAFRIIINADLITYRTRAEQLLESIKHERKINYPEAEPSRY